ncbi:hypothetical protein E8E13_010224 [Curvularia kusanoi]|uniref:Uncharacterized protein n=1 Tax=Curvularia kusanoi TaxID=90978 RepID=A0A9P4TLF1_CURKU|nr:hypothetical protein E8E13_010224 [Curvularia kusanoi]
MAASLDNNSTETRLTKTLATNDTFSVRRHDVYLQKYQPITIHKDWYSYRSLPDARQAHEALQALAQRYSVAGVTNETHVDHSFSIVGADKTRAFWVVEVGHARALEIVDFDDN